ncbi:DNA repair protein RadC [Cellvibrio sp. KY-GH-1]|uniref:JAB domain-containing protein n=1 Tax=Cellvibrio sp. KY-GH-1 TaxID=2303332 RepID=UPI001247FB8A|nr:DNA repair protein RadC [Cellvibrio sp. KY-GH-1]QEY16020.1 DNA repair protein RadC [Cellvibrio sp. KY-GH-1]
MMISPLVALSSHIRHQPTFNYTTAEEVINAAKHIMESMMEQRDTLLTSPQLVRQYLMLRLGKAEREIFCVIFLDNQNRLIASEDLFMGTIDGAAVYPREVVKAALKYNAAAVLLAHNHPSGMLEASTADQRITQRLVSALELVDVRVLDHFIVSGTESLSFAERGLI